MTRVEIGRLTIVAVATAIVTIGLVLLLNYNETAAYIATPIVVVSARSDWSSWPTRPPARPNNTSPPCSKRSEVATAPRPDTVLTGEALEFVQRLAREQGISIARALAHAIALQRAVIDEQADGAWVTVERRSGEFLELIPI